MKPLLPYLLGTLFCSGLFVAAYRLLLVGHLSFPACRRYLMAAAMLSLLLPALRIPLYPAPPAVETERIVHTGIPEQEEFVPEEQVVMTAEPTTESHVDRTLWINRLIGMIYGAVTILLLVMLLRRWMAVRRLRRQCVLTRLPHYTLAEGASVHTPFSFLRTIFLSPGFRGVEREQIVCHEASHVRHRHTTERIVLEAVRCLCWYNPFVWMIGSDLREVQEWEADRDVLDKGYDLAGYRTLIFRQLFGYGPDLICGLNQSFTKKRFLMMTHAGGGKYAFVRLCALVPVVAAMLALCSFTTKSPDGGDVVPAAGEQPVEPVAEIRIAGERILLDNEPTALADLPARLRQMREKGIGTAVLTASPDTKISLVTAVKQAIRESDLLSVRYHMAGTPDVSRILPPPVTDGQTSVVQVVPDASGMKVYSDGNVAIRQRNLLQVFIDDKGGIAVGTRAKKLNDLAALKRTVERFIRNADDDPELPEKELRLIALPGGGTWNYPASLGVVGLRTSQATGFGTYVAVLDALTEAFGTIRNEAAVAQFGRGYDALDKAEREAVNQAVPICISEAEPDK